MCVAYATNSSHHLLTRDLPNLGEIGYRVIAIPMAVYILFTISL